MTRQQLFCRLFCILFGCVLLVGASTPTYESKNLPFDPSTVDSSTNKKTTKDTALGSFTISPITMIKLGQRDPVSVTISIVNLALTLLGFGFLILLIYAGVIWVLARGNEEDITKAKSIIKRSLTGLIIILGSIGLSTLIFNQIVEKTSS